MNGKRLLLSGRSLGEYQLFVQLRVSKQSNVLGSKVYDTLGEYYDPHMIPPCSRAQDRTTKVCTSLALQRPPLRRLRRVANIGVDKDTLPNQSCCDHFRSAAFTTWNATLHTSRTQHWPLTIPTTTSTDVAASRLLRVMTLRPSSLQTLGLQDQMSRT